MERFFQLARSDRPAGWVGQITSNSFMKREFGSAVIENFLTRKDLQLVADTSGAFIPGHGTPTVIMVGRNQAPAKVTVRAVLGIRGEPARPEFAAEGNVWSSISQHIGDSGYEDDWISVTDVPRAILRNHPWSLTGGGAQDLSARLDHSNRNLAGEDVDIGMTYLTLEDDAYILSPIGARINHLGSDAIRVVIGDEVRDFRIAAGDMGLLPNTIEGIPRGVCNGSAHHFWRYRTNLSSRLYFGKVPSERGLRWYDIGMYFAKRHTSPLSIPFAFVATHNHFALDRGGKVFNRSAPAIKLAAGATEDDHLRLLGTLNSSTACFWLKQNSHSKGNEGYQSGIKSQMWERFYEFTSTTLQDFPLPGGSALDRARLLDSLAQRISNLSPPAIVGRSGADRKAIRQTEAEEALVRSLMISEQEELDWEVYGLYDLIDEDLTYPHPSDPDQTGSPSLPGIALGERAFEIALARKVQAGTETTEWFARHGSTPITEIPTHWPADYRALVQKRLDLIASDKFIGLLERPEYKRRWQQEPWAKRLTQALRDHLLDRLEARSLWFNDQNLPQARSVAEIAGIVETQPEFAGFTDALDLWVGRRGESVVESLGKLLEPEAVPYLAALRYKDSGLRKRAEWESTWDAQRAEDAGIRDARADPIPVPPKYTGADFVKQSYWSHRGKLDVPKERFIGYPGAGRVTDPSALLGWAGWDHAKQALALGRLYTDRSTESFDTQVLTPLVAGIAELLPWVKQWHSGIDPELGIDLGEYLDAQLESWTAALSVPREDLPMWRPPPAIRGRRSAAKTTSTPNAATRPTAARKRPAGAGGQQ